MYQILRKMAFLVQHSSIFCETCTYHTIFKEKRHLGISQKIGIIRRQLQS
jgi:hypothetical protein